MNCSQLGLVVGAIVVSINSATAADLQVSVEGLVSPTDKTTTLTVRTSRTTGKFPLPASDRPKFWFDCTQRSGWTFDADGNVTKIPSLVGDRSLTTGGLVSWTGWSNGSKPPLAPKLVVADSSLGGLPALDFGKLGSMQALVFDAVGASAVNEYANIGTVIAVWGSQNGGGWLLGGGPGTATGNNSYSMAWWRGGSWSKATGTYVATFDYDSPVLGYDYAAAAGKNGVVRHDGMPTIPTKVGFNHGWEVVTLSPTEASLVATGLGVGDSRSGQPWYSGGMKVAELMIFERLLTPVEMSKIETWLRQKWFGQSVEGVDGCARVSRISPRNSEEEATVTAVVPADEVLSIGFLEGMRGRNSALVKAGAGAMEIKEATGFAALTKIEGGSLKFSGKRPIPALSDLTDLYLHFDATDLASVISETRDGTEYVSYWKDLLGGKIWNKQAFFRQTIEANQPRILRNAVGTGLHMIDFGTLSAPRWMRVAKGDVNADGSIASSADSSIGGVSTIIAVMGVQAGGGRITILDLPACERYKNGFDASKYSAQFPILNSKIIDASRGISATNGTVWVNGLKIGHEEGYGTPGYVVVALRVPGDTAQYLAAGLNSSQGVDFGGGFRLGEMFIYNRILGDREVEDVSAYLMNRWFGREAPGYAKVADRAALADVQDVSASEGTSLDVEAGVVAHIGAVSASGNIAKTGAGTLDVEKLTAAKTLTIDGGKVRTIDEAAVPAVALAASPCLHLDAADASTFELVSGDGIDYVKRWYSKDRLNAAYLTYGNYLYRPWLNADKAVRDVPMVDFGDYGNGAYLVLEKALYSMRDVFVIIDGEKGGGYLFSGRGSCNNLSGDECPNYKHSMPGEPMDYFPDIWTSPRALIAPNMSAITAYGEILTNGVAVTASCKFPKSAALLEFRPQAATGAYLIGCEKPWGSRGGFRLGEVIVYDRKLSARERVATRNYLMAKWFGRAPEALPDEDTKSEIVALAGTGGSFEKANGGDLTIGDLTSFSGTVAVAAGSMTLAKSLPAVEPKLATEGRIAHFDASDAASLTLVGKDGYTGVSEWRSQVNGWKAAAVAKYFGDKTTDLPQLKAASLNGKATVFLPETSGAMLFENADGLTNDVVGIRSAFWVIGTVNDVSGGYLMGGGCLNSSGRGKRSYAWARSDAGRLDANASILGDISLDYLRWRFDWMLDDADVSIERTAFGPERWHVLNSRVKEGWEQGVITASGFAFDGRLLDNENGWNDFWKYSGRQNLAEVILYDRRLTDQERAETLAYLQAKWGFCLAAQESGTDLSVSAGAVVDLGGRQKMRSVSGGGLIEGTLDVATLSADCAVMEAAAVPEIRGTLRLSDGYKVRLSHFNAARGVCLVPIARAQNIVGDRQAFTLVGDALPDGWRAKLRFADGLLSAEVGPKPGFSVIVR